CAPSTVSRHRTPLTGKNHSQSLLYQNGRLVSISVDCCSPLFDVQRTRAKAITRLTRLSKNGIASWWVSAALEHPTTFRTASECRHSPFRPESDFWPIPKKMAKSTHFNASGRMHFFQASACGRDMSRDSKFVKSRAKTTRKTPGAGKGVCISVAIPTCFQTDNRMHWLQWARPIRGFSPLVLA